MSLKIILAAIAIACASAHCHAQKTTRPSLKLENPSLQSSTDTITANRGDLTFAGYEKSQSAWSESVFVTNNTAASITSIIMTLTYYDIAGNKIHSRRWTARCILPPSETRVIDIKAWDRQNAWYYKHSRASHNKNGSPFDVKIKADCYVVNRQ